MDNKTLNEQELENVSGGQEVMPVIFAESPSHGGNGVVLVGATSGNIDFGKKTCIYVCDCGNVFGVEYDKISCPKAFETCPVCGASAKYNGK